MNYFEPKYKALVQEVLQHGTQKSSRVGPVRSLFGTTLRIRDMLDGGFPILTTRQILYKPVLGELAAFLQGATELATFKDLGCNYWDANAKAWPPNKGLGTEQMRVGRIYGAQWRSWIGPDDDIDQLWMMIQSIKKDPHGRRHLVSAWQPAEADDMCLPPCHIVYQCCVTNTRLDMIVYMRSVDLCLGLPSDIVLYATLLQLICNETGYVPGELVFMMGDTHVYENHIELFKEQFGRREHDLPSFELQSGIDDFMPGDLKLIDYNYAERMNYALNT